ncbi:MAG: EamA family transporter [Firmicutes bacterium]|nr:EamA family transporter [Bacillota bacterium]MBR3375806.1 EamA family transporter [Bacillota bacterium]
MFIASVLIFGTIGIFRRYIPLSSGMLAFLRGLLGAGFLAVYKRFYQKNRSYNISSKNMVLLLITGALIGLNWMLLFEAYNYTSVSVATLCYYMQPTIVILLSPLVFSEKLTGKRMICALAAVIGMVLVSGVIGGGAGQDGDLKGIACGLGAAALYATVVILNKRIHVDDAIDKTIVQLITAAAVMMPYLALSGRGQMEFDSIGTTTVIMVLIVGIIHTGIAYALYFGSMENLKAQSVAVLSYLDPVFALILSAVILGERMTVFGIIGAVLIIGSAIISETGNKEENI